MTTPTPGNLMAQPGDVPTAATNADAAFSRPAAWSSVFLLGLVAVINTTDRQLPGVLTEAIKHDLNLSDTALGLINGFGFLVIYALLGVPIARIADRGIYGGVISVCLALWSAMTALGGMATTGLQLALTRMGVAVGEAGSTPAAHAFIARNFPPHARAAPLAVLTAAIPLSSVTAVYGGGLLGQHFGWRAAFVIMGAAGLLLSVPVLLLLRPRQALPHGAPRPASAAVSRGAIRTLFRKPSFVLILGGSACIACAGYVVGAFVPAFLARVHHMSLAQIGISFGLGNAVGGVTGVLLAGSIADRLARRDPRWTLWVLVIMIAALLPFVYAAFVVDSAAFSVFGIILAGIIGSAYLALVVAAIQRLAASEMRATASALLLMFSALAGGLGPLATGMISDALEPTLGAKSLARGMLVIPVGYTIAAILYLAASFRFRRDMTSEA